MLYKEIEIPTVLNPESIARLNSQLRDCESSETKFIVLKGSDKIFCNGLDISWVANSEGADHLHDMALYGEFLKQLQTGKFISIALVRGAVSGGGMGIVCACDYVISEPSASFSLPEGLLGLIPGMILPSLLNRLTPINVKKMVYSGKKYAAIDALQLSVVDEIQEDLLTALNLAIQTMRACKLGAIADIKEILYLDTQNKDALAKRGMEILQARLHEEEIKTRLKDIADFM